MWWAAGVFLTAAGALLVVLSRPARPITHMEQIEVASFILGALCVPVGVLMLVTMAGAA